MNSIDMESDEILKEALDSGMDLNQYLNNINDQIVEAEQVTIDDSLNQIATLNNLYSRLKTTDNTLEQLENILVNFQENLGSISSEIQSLQETSLDISIKLRNRQELHQDVCQFVDELTISEALIATIMDANVTDQDFIECLHELNHKIKFIREQKFAGASAASDVEDTVMKLKYKAIAKLREYLLQKIFTYRKPLTNYQISQNQMLTHRFFYEFLLSNDRNTAGQIRDEYIETASKMYFSYFKGYLEKLQKLEFKQTARKTDLIGKIEESDLRRKNAKNQSNYANFTSTLSQISSTIASGVTSASSSSKNLASKGTVFTLSGRADILKTEDLEAPVIIPHAEKKSDAQYHYESLFRSFNYALLDNCCREYLFVKDFFLMENAAADKLFLKIMNKTLQRVKSHLIEQVEKTHDSIALFICIHIIYRFQIICHKRNVPCLDDYWEFAIRTITPKIDRILYENINSIAKIDISQLDIDTRPHYVSRRYAEFAASFTYINDNFMSDSVDMIMTEMQQTIEVCIQQMATVFPNRKSQLVFLINNYDVILSVLNETNTQEPCKEATIFGNQLRNRCAEYIELTLAPFIGEIMDIVNEKSGPSFAFKKENIQAICSNFNNKWKSSLDRMNQEIMRSFTNFKNGTSLLQSCLNGLVQYYAKFLKIVQGEKHLNDIEMISVHQVMLEVKNYSGLRL